MKKLLTLLLVLGFATTANAVTLQISVNGDIDPIDSEIILCPGDTLILDIHSPSGYASAADATYFALVVDGAYGSITGGVILEASPDWSALYGQSAVADFFPCLNPGEDGPWGEFSGPPGTTAGPGMWADEFLFECLGEGDAVVRLIGTTDFGTCNVFDTVTIHQVPEPASMLLLGLGGLLLRRRK